MAIIRDAATAVISQMQRLDAFLLETLYQNVQNVQRIQATPPALAQGDPGYQRTAAPDLQNNLWPSTGLRRMELGEPDVIALQIAPWTFITSSYAASLLCMAILLNRIQHIVVPPRGQANGRLNSWFPKLFPINATSTFTRFCLRAPSLYLLYKALLRLTIIVMQAFDVFPTIQVLEPLGRWAAGSTMVDVCWSTFGAVCVGLIIGTLTRGLDGSGLISSSFNLPQFAFLLHLYSYPYGSMFNRSDDSSIPAKPPPRPSKHVLLTLLLPLLQITMIHTEGIWIRFSRHLLIPTTICGVFALVHFVCAFWAQQMLEYPLLQLVPSTLELFLVFAILLTTSLNALTQILLQGRISRPLFNPGAGSFPTMDEEFSVALIRLGTTSLEATSAAGLGNEVAELRKEGLVELGPSGVLSISPSRSASKGKRSTRNPFAQEIKHVKAKSVEGDLWINVAWMKELHKFCLVSWRVLKRLWNGAARPNTSHNQRAVSVSMPDIDDNTSILSEKDEEVYRRFLDGEDVSDDETEFNGDDHKSGYDTSGETVGGDDIWDCRSEDELETSQLFSEHGTQRQTSPFAPVLLAHLTTSPGSPLTRRRYSTLVRRYSHLSEEDSRVPVFPGGWSVPNWRSDAVINQQDNGEDDERRRMCVICMCADRVVICWPCRCLSMCDDCRGNLASRSPSSRHHCPCCRRPVEGFSRIFIP